MVAGHPILPKRTAKNAVLFMFNPFGIKIYGLKCSLKFPPLEGDEGGYSTPKKRCHAFHLRRWHRGTSSGDGVINTPLAEAKVTNPLMVIHHT